VAIPRILMILLPLLRLGFRQFHLVVKQLGSGNHQLLYFVRRRPSNGNGRGMVPLYLIGRPHGIPRQNSSFLPRWLPFKAGEARKGREANSIRHPALSPLATGSGSNPRCYTSVTSTALYFLTSRGVDSTIIPSRSV